MTGARCSRPGRTRRKAAAVMDGSGEQLGGGGEEGGGGRGPDEGPRDPVGSGLGWESAGARGSIPPGASAPRQRASACAPPGRPGLVAGATSCWSPGLGRVPAPPLGPGVCLLLVPGSPCSEELGCRPGPAPCPSGAVARLSMLSFTTRVPSSVSLQGYEPPQPPDSSWDLGVQAPLSSSLHQGPPALSRS